MESSDSLRPSAENLDLPRLVVSENWNDRRQAVKSILELASTGKPTAIQNADIDNYLEILSKDVKWEVRNDVAFAMLKLKTRYCFDAIIARLSKDPHYDVRRSAEQTLKRSKHLVNVGLLNEDDVLSTEEYEMSLRKVLPPREVARALKLSHKRFELFVKASNHELKRVITPLQSRISKAKALLQSKKTTSKIKEHISRAEERCEFLTRLLDDMESWIMDTPPALTREKIADIVSESFSLVHDYFKTKKPHLKVQKKQSIPGDIYVDVPRAGIVRAFRNIIQNSYEAFDKSGSITIRGELKENSVWLSFQDNGCGISQETRRDAFRPFASTKNSTGFGLPIAYKIIHHDCGGAITIPEPPRKGTVVLVSLPLSNELRSATP